MRVDKLTAQEWIDLQKAQSISFAMPVDLEALQKKVDESADQEKYQKCWGAFDGDGRLISGLVNWPYQAYYDGHIVGMGGIGGVVTLPERRMHGNVKSILRQVFIEMRRNGDLFSVLFPFSQRFYRQFGYEVCHEGRTYQFPTKELSCFRQTGTARMHSPGEPDDVFRTIYQQFACRYNYAVARNDIAWERMLKGDPYKDQVYRYVLSRDDRDVSYCMITPIKTGDMQNDMHVFDFAYTDSEALFDLLGFLYRLWPQFENVRIEPPSDLALGALIEEPNELSLSGLNHSMARVIDVTKALSLKRHPAGEGSYSIAVKDDFIPENSGVYEVHFKAHVSEVIKHPEDQRCDLSVSVQTFAQLCVGYLSLRMSLLKPDVRLFGNRETLECVFTEKPRFFTDRF